MVDCEEGIPPMAIFEPGIERIHPRYTPNPENAPLRNTRKVLKPTVSDFASWQMAAGATLSFGMLLATVTVAVAAYLLGSIPTGYLLIRIFRHEDIRAIGSGNIGATNVLRSGGKGLGLATFLIDMLKGCAAVYLARMAAISLIAHGMPIESIRNFEALAALSAVLGHMFPPWLRFRGGKGVATGFGVFLVAAPLAALAAITVFFLTIVITRYVSLGSILGAASFPVFAWLFVRGDRPPFFIAVQFIVAGLIIAKHYPNIRRLLAGKESRFGAKKPA
jgi:glycerol-3-phosphate acyltransferase PlsY